MTLTTLKRQKIHPAPYPAYDYQVPAIKSVVSTVLAGENGLVVQPTGIGKSTEIAFAIRILTLMHGKRGLYLYEENEGILQARKKCDEIFADNKALFANFFGYGKDHHVDTADVVFASVQSLNHYQTKWYQMFAEDHFDYIMYNEAHHGEAVTHREVLDYFTCSKIGFTATPERMDGKDILSIFHKIIHENTLEEAIVKGWLAQIDYHIMSCGLSRKKLKEICREVLEGTKRRVSIKQLNESVFVDKLDDEVFKEIYKYAFPENDTPKQTLIFCENILHADRVYDRLVRDGKSANVVHSGKGKGHNKDATEQFKASEFQFMVAVDKYNEDIDIPGVELGVMLRATNSKTIFYQQLGRMLRRTKFKNKAVILDFVANVERLVMVQELSKSIFDLSQSLLNLEPLDKNPFSVSGVGFSFEFEDEMIDLLKAISAIDQGYYESWQEASKAAMDLNLWTREEYCKQYKKDPKLPQHPRYTYSDFPGFRTFLKRSEIQLTEIAKTELAKHNITNRQSLISFGRTHFKKAQFGIHGKGDAFCSLILGDLGQFVTIARMEKIADKIGWKVTTKDEQFNEYRQELAKHGIKDRKSLLSFGINRFMRKQFGRYGGGLAFSNTLLKESNDFVKRSTLEKIADQLGLETIPVSQESINEWKGELAKHGITDRESLISFGPVHFSKTSFSNYGKGTAFSSLILGGNRDIKYETISILEKVADRLGGKVLVFLPNYECNLIPMLCSIGFFFSTFISKLLAT